MLEILRATSKVATGVVPAGRDAITAGNPPSGLGGGDGHPTNPLARREAGTHRDSKRDICGTAPSSQGQVSCGGIRRHARRSTILRAKARGCRRAPGCVRHSKTLRAGARRWRRAPGGSTDQKSFEPRPGGGDRHRGCPPFENPSIRGWEVATGTRGGPPSKSFEPVLGGCDGHPGGPPFKNSSSRGSEVATGTSVPAGQGSQLSAGRKMGIRRGHWGHGARGAEEESWGGVC